MDVDFSIGGPSDDVSTNVTPMMTPGPMWPPQQQAMSNTAVPQHPYPNLFGIVIPGGPVRTDFIPVDASGTKFTMQWVPPIVPSSSPTNIDNTASPQKQQQPNNPLSSINEIVAFLLPEVSFPHNFGALFYWQVSALSPSSVPIGELAASTGFALLGALTPNQPSSIFRTGWSEREDLIEMERSAMLVGSLAPQQLVVTFGVSLESLDNIQNLPNKSDSERRLFVAQKIATDLFTFMQSFDTGSHQRQGQMVVPTNIFDRWFQRFEARFRRDPNFFLKSQS